MIIFELAENDESHVVYHQLTIENGERLYDFLKSIIDAAIALERPYLSSQVIKALNYHAIACLHSHAGEYRPCSVRVGSHQPPEEFRVQALMDDFVNQINRNWDLLDPLQLAVWALWRLNWIHPFINGNGRISRAVAYFILCVKVGARLPGKIILPELIVRERERYVQGLRKVDDNQDFSDLHSLLGELLKEQLDSARDRGAEAAL